MALALQVARVHGAMLGMRKHASPERKPVGVTMSFDEVEAALAEGKEVGLLNLLHYSQIKAGREMAEVKRIFRAQKLKQIADALAQGRVLRNACPFFYFSSKNIRKR